MERVYGGVLEYSYSVISFTLNIFYDGVTILHTMCLLYLSSKFLVVNKVMEHIPNVAICIVVSQTRSPLLLYVRFVPFLNHPLHSHKTCAKSFIEYNK